MRSGWGNETGECRFDVPPRFAVAERRMAGLAVAAWLAGGKARVGGFENNSLIVQQVDGVPVIAACPDALTAAFGIAAGMALTCRDGLAGELVAACDLIVLRPEPAPFEASVAVTGRSLVLVRGVALPLLEPRVDGPAESEIQIVLSWREVLNRAATARLRGEIGAALQHLRPYREMSDPFSQNSGG